MVQSGWFRSLLHPVGSKIGKKLDPFEMEMISNLQNTIHSTGEGPVLLLAQMWGVSERTINRKPASLAEDHRVTISPNKLSNKNEVTNSKHGETSESPKLSRKRKESQQMPISATKSNKIDHYENQSIEARSANVDYQADNNAHTEQATDSARDKFISINESMPNRSQQPYFRSINSNAKTVILEHKKKQTIKENSRKSRKRRAT